MHPFFLSSVLLVKCMRFWSNKKAWHRNWRLHSADGPWCLQDSPGAIKWPHLQASALLAPAIDLSFCSSYPIRTFEPQSTLTDYFTKLPSTAEPQHFPACLRRYEPVDIPRRPSRPVERLRRCTEITSKQASGSSEQASGSKESGDPKSTPGSS